MRRTTTTILLAVLLAAAPVSARVWRFTCSPQRVAAGLCSQAQADAATPMLLLGWSVEESKGDEVLDAIARGWGWEPQLPDGSINPETAEFFANKRLQQWIAERVRRIRAEQAANDAFKVEIEKPLLDLGPPGVD